MDDLEFVQLCAKGDKESWGQFLERYSRLIYSYIHGVLESKGFSLAQDEISDIFHDIFYSLIKDNFKKLKSYRAKNNCSLASWLRQVTVNFTIDYLRRRRVVVSLDEEISENFTLKDTIAGNLPSTLELLDYDELLRALSDCIKDLSSEDKHIIDLNINRGLSLNILKKHLRISRGAMDMRKSRIIEKLRECFKGKGFALDI